MLDFSSAGALETAPLSFFQESLWFFYQMEPESRVYNRGFLFHLSGPLDVALLEKSFNAIVCRHAAMRTTIKDEDGTAYQRVHAFAPFSLPVVDVPGVVAEERQARAESLLRADLNLPFHLTTHAGWRAQLFRFDAEDHYLIFTIHHIFFDGRSSDIFVSELFQGYESASRGAADLSLAGLPLSFADLARAQRAGPRPGFDPALDAWAQRLDDAAPNLNLPTDRPYPAYPTYEMSVLSHRFEGQTKALLKLVARQTGATTYTVFLAALAGLLHRHTGQEDILIGCPFANRAAPESKDVIGYFINTLPLRLRVRAELSLLELVEQAREFLEFAKANQDIPFDKLVARVNPTRTRNRHPMFQVMLNKLTFTYQRAEIGRLTIEHIPFHLLREVFDIEFRLYEDGDGLTMLYKYNTHLFRPETIERLAERFDILLRDALRAPERSVSAWRMLPDAELETILRGWNDTRLDLPRACAHERVEEQARRRPEAVAVEDESRSLTYAELWARVQSLSGRLLRAGVGPGQRVGVCLNRGVDLPAALLAVMQAGAAYVPIDPAYPAERIRLILEDAKPVLCLTEHALVSRLDWGGIPTLSLDDNAEPEISSERRAASLSDAAYVIYTSGSTGKPKGVQIPHRALTNLLIAIGQEIGFSESDLLLAVTTISFDISNLELFLPLVNGATVYIADSVTMADGRLLKKKLEHLRPTWMQATPATWKMLLASGWTGGPGLSILCGGEALPSDLAGRLLSKSRALWNVYGPTEAAIWATLYPVTRAEAAIPIGKPIGNMRAYILDPHRNVLPPGVMGDLYLAGVGVGDGYLNRPEQTAAVFLPDAFFPGERMYFTGDRASYRPDGNILFHGRSDHQVKVRGFRIELEEVETAIKQSPAVRDAAVIVQNDSQGDPTLAAFCISKTGSLSVEELRLFLSGKLPAYMLPSVISQVDSFPLTPAGKVDRKALLSYKSLPLREQYVAPVTDLETRLADIWKDVLGAEQISIAANFFDAGGHSLMAVRLFARIEEEFGVRLPLATLFTHGSIARLAELLSTNNPALTTALIPMRVEGSKPPVFLFPGVGGDVLSMRGVAVNLSADQPAYGLQYNIDDQTSSWAIEQLADQFAGQMISNQPSASYRLAGTSFGGLLAYETAINLLRRGKQVALLVMMDTLPPGVQGNITFMQRLSAHMVNMNDMDGPGQIQYLLQIAQKAFLRVTGKGFFRQGFSKFLLKLGRRNLLPKSVTANFLNLLDKRQAMRLMIRQYQPPLYPGDVVIFRATQRLWYMKWNPVERWREFIQGRLEFVDFPYRHYDFAQSKYAPQTAQALQALLDQAADK